MALKKKKKRNFTGRRGGVRWSVCFFFLVFSSSCRFMHSLCKNENIPMWGKNRCSITKEIAIHLTRIITYYVFLKKALLFSWDILIFDICIGNSMISSDIWHKYLEWCFKIVISNSWAVRQVKFETILKYHEWYLCQISRTNHAVICLYYYPQKVVIFTCRYYKLSWNTAALSQ